MRILYVIILFPLTALAGCHFFEPRDMRSFTVIKDKKQLGNLRP